MTELKRNLMNGIREYFGKGLREGGFIEYPIDRMIYIDEFSQEIKNDYIDDFIDLVGKVCNIEFSDEEKNIIKEFNLLDRVYYNFMFNYIYTKLINALTDEFKDKIIDYVFDYNKYLIPYIDIRVDNIEYVDDGIKYFAYYEISDKNVEKLADYLLINEPDVIGIDEDLRKVIDENYLVDYLDESLGYIKDGIENEKYLNDILNRIYDVYLIDFDKDYEMIYNDEFIELSMDYKNIEDYLRNVKKDIINKYKEKINKLNSLNIKSACAI